MQTKLTLRLEEELIDQAKEYAEKTGKSVSQLVADYFQLLAGRKEAPPQQSAPVTRSLRGILRQTTAAAISCRPSASKSPTAKLAISPSSSGLNQLPAVVVSPRTMGAVGTGSAGKTTAIEPADSTPEGAGYFPAATSRIFFFRS